MKLLVLIVCTLVICSVQGESPPDLPKCKNGDNACQTKAANEVVQKFYKGQRDLNIVPFDPLRVKSIVLEKSNSGPVNVELKLHDVDIIGLKNMQVKSYEGLNADFNGRTTFEAIVPELKLEGMYTIDGQVVILPITGSGAAQIVVKNAHFKFSYDLKPTEKNGKTYATLEHVKLEMTPEQVSFHFENLLGDKKLGEDMNKLINENWSDFYKELSPGFSKAISLVVKSAINTFFEKTPYADYFL